MPDKNKSNLRQAMSAAYSVLGALMLFGGVGYWLDKRSGGDTWWLLIGLILGVVVGMYELAKMVLKK